MDSMSEIEREIEKKVSYDNSTGEITIVIPDSTVPMTLPLRTEEEIQARCITITPKEDLASVFAMCEPISSESEASQDWEDIQSDSDWESDVNNNVQSVIPVPTGSQVLPNQQDSRNSKCPILGCGYYTRKLKHHVQHRHLPRIMWDNPQPPVKEEKMEELNHLRREALNYLAYCIVGKPSPFALMRQVVKNEVNLIPPNTVLLYPLVNQMTSLCRTLNWTVPSRFRLTPPNSPSVLIHWRYQAVLSQYLLQEQYEVYLQKGATFMSDIDNLKNSPYNYARERSLLASVIYCITVKNGDEPLSDDEGQDSCRHIPLEREENWEEELIPHEDRRVVCSEQEQEEIVKLPVVRQIESLEVFDTHFHLDRMKALLNFPTLTVGRILSEQMERPPLVNVDLKGGVLIYCDPETYPEEMPLDTRWKLAIGFHPKRVGKSTPEEREKFFQFMENPRITAVGEVGVDISLRQGDRKHQENFLVEVLRRVNKHQIVIVHVRSTKPDKYAYNLYQEVLNIFQERCHPKQKVVLHCFTGNSATRSNWSKHFPNTFFGLTSMINRFDRNQLETIREIPDNRLLIETDAPYMSPPGIAVNSPIYIGEMIPFLAEQRNCTPREVSRITTINAVTLFGDQ